MKLREYLASDDFQDKSLEEKQGWLSKNVKGYDLLPMQEQRKLFTGLGVRPESIKTKVQLADQALTGAIPGGKMIQDIGMQMGGAALGGSGGTMVAPFTGPAAPAMPFAGARMGEGVGQMFSDMLHGSSAKAAAPDLYKTPLLNTAFMGAFKGLGKGAEKIFPSYSKFMHGIDPKLADELIESKGNLPKATQKETTEMYTRALRKATGSTMEPKEELDKLANQFEGKLGGKADKEVMAAKKQLEELKPMLEKQYPGMFDKTPDAAKLRDAVRKAGVDLPDEGMMKKIFELPERAKKGLPTKVPISPTGGTASQEEQIAYHLRRLEKNFPKDAAGEKEFNAEAYRLRRWIDHVRNYGGDDVTDAKSLDKGVKMRLDEARARVQDMLKKTEGGQEIQAADKRLIRETAGRKYRMPIPEGRGSIYHMGARISPFLLYHLLGIPFMPAALMTMGMSSPKLAQLGFKYGPKLAPTAARAAGLTVRDIFDTTAQEDESK